MNKKILITALCALTSVQVHAAASNPASVNYVNQAVAAGVAQTTYTAGTAISILNNIISGAYTGSNGVAVNGAAITGAYTASSGVHLDGTEFKLTHYTVGQQALGGVVVLVDANSNGQHGLIAMLADATIPSDSGTPISSLSYFPGYFVGTSTPVTSFNAYAEFGIGDGYGNTVLVASAGAWATDTPGGTTAGLERDTYPASLALSYHTNVGGVGTGCTGADGEGNGICIGGWYIPNENEFYITNNALCGTEYALTTEEAYWISTQANISDVRKVTTNVAASCVLEFGEGAEGVAPSTTGNLGRWVRRF